ncbi:MAG: tRNA epoxyqueuosine(34) reductase QueG [Nitrospirae bacterium]|nr:tRNA epoxyqueuosine(34) reductase QueG [Nitrospirota bacterium]
MTFSEEIKREARRLGFSAVGISRIAEREEGTDTPLPRFLHARLLEWLRRGYHGTMDWMARVPDRRADPRRALAGCRSVISVGMNYYTSHQADEQPGHGRIARYAWGEDYHEVLMRRLAQLEARIKTLAPQAQTRSYVDTGPIMEKAWAQQAGLGWIGKHSNLVSDQYGSWLLLGEILTTLDLDPDEPGTDLCGSCTLCIKACPTGAITEPYVVDARKCISYLTIELRGPGAEIPDELTPKLGNRIFGCDDCLDVCPYNVNASPTAEPAFQPSPLTLAPTLEALANISEREFTATFRRSPIRRPKHTGFLRNVRTAIRNLRLSASSHHPPAVPTG